MKDYKKEVEFAGPGEEFHAVKEFQQPGEEFWKTSYSYEAVPDGKGKKDKKLLMFALAGVAAVYLLPGVLLNDIFHQTTQSPEPVKPPAAWESDAPGTDNPGMEEGKEQEPQADINFDFLLADCQGIHQLLSAGRYVDVGNALCHFSAAWAGELSKYAQEMTLVYDTAHVSMFSSQKLAKNQGFYLHYMVIENALMLEVCWMDTDTGKEMTGMVYTPAIYSSDAVSGSVSYVTGALDKGLNAEKLQYASFMTNQAKSVEYVNDVFEGRVVNGHFTGAVKRYSAFALAPKEDGTGFDVIDPAQMLLYDLDEAGRLNLEKIACVDLSAYAYGTDEYFNAMGQMIRNPDVKYYVSRDESGNLLINIRAEGRYNQTYSNFSHNLTGGVTDEICDFQMSLSLYLDILQALK